MTAHELSAYLVPSTDAHTSEYLPEVWQRRAWISGFDGSAGDVIVTREKAGLWTDSRYFLQAEEQLKGSTIDLFKIGVAGTASKEAFLCQSCQRGDRVGIDARLISHDEADQLKKALGEKGISLVFPSKNLVDEIWEDQGDLPLTPIEIWPEEFAGESVAQKLERIREKMRAEDVQAHVLTMLDAIAWTFNIRSGDVDFNPLAIGYAVIGASDAHLFTRLPKVTDAVRECLGDLVEIHDYFAFEDFLTELEAKKMRIWLDGATVNERVVRLLEAGGNVMFKESPVTRFKACKNETELKGMAACHIRDGVAMVKFLRWLEEHVASGQVSEVSAGEKLTAFRAEDPRFRGPSFATIAGYGEHGAIVHYEASAESDVTLRPEGVFLIDSGGQYLDGTTDITRTVALGEPTAEQKDRFTRVLKGHIALATARFPQGTTGPQLDTLARKPLWDIGLQYGHGTGHGVGCYLSVHEGPQSISYYRGAGVALELGMICSNEPGFYKAGEFGMRIETLVSVVVDAKADNPELVFYTFDTLTLCPMDLNLVEPSLLTDDEIYYLNAYHARTRQALEPLLDESHKAWLKKATEPI